MFPLASGPKPKGLQDLFHLHWHPNLSPCLVSLQHTRKPRSCMQNTEHGTCWGLLWFSPAARLTRTAFIPAPFTLASSFNTDSGVALKACLQCRACRGSGIPRAVRVLCPRLSHSPDTPRVLLGPSACCGASWQQGSLCSLCFFSNHPGAGDGKDDYRLKGRKEGRNNTNTENMMIMTDKVGKNCFAEGTWFCMRKIVKIRKAAVLKSGYRYIPSFPTLSLKI